MNLLIVENHALVRHGLVLLLGQEPDIDVVAEAGSLAELPDTDTLVDVVATGIMLPDGEGAHVVTAVLDRFPQASVIVVTSLDDPDVAVAALGAGASGFVSKNVSAAELIDAIRRVHRGERYVQPSLAFEIASRAACTVGEAQLSRRELDVLRFIAAGYTNAEIARSMSLSLRTVEGHRSSARQKLGLRTRADIVRYCWDAGLYRGRRRT